MIVACLGLFGLAAFTAERRTKEIGIRKVLGARIRDIVQLLAWQFSRPVVIANLIAWPVAWWAMRDWLNTLRHPNRLGPGTFRFAGAARARDRDRNDRRPRLPGRPGQSDPRAQIRIKEKGRTMWRNYLTVGLRALLQSRTYAFINIFGLATGLAACLMLLIYVRYERSYDDWLPNAENLYQLQTHYVPGESSSGPLSQMSAYVAGPSLQASFPEIERRVYMRASAPTVVRGGEALVVDNARMVDGPFFDMFRIPMLHGDPATALARVRQRRAVAHARRCGCSAPRMRSAGRSL